MFTLIHSLKDQELANYLARQVNNMFPDGNDVTPDVIATFLPVALKRLSKCFSHINNKYFFDGKNTVFNHLHSDQYSMFLYLACNTAYKMNFPDAASKIFLLNKALHGIDAFYEIELPEIFLFVHPLGTVLGRAKYSNYFMVYQGCGVGSNHDIYPELGEFVTLRPKSFVLGKSKVGRNCSFGADSLMLDRDLEDNTLYLGNPMGFKVKTVEKVATIWRV